MTPLELSGFKSALTLLASQNTVNYTVLTALTSQFYENRLLCSPHSTACQTIQTTLHFS